MEEGVFCPGSLTLSWQTPGTYQTPVAPMASPVPGSYNAWRPPAPKGQQLPWHFPHLGGCCSRVPLVKYLPRISFSWYPRKQISSMFYQCSIPESSLPSCEPQSHPLQQGLNLTLEGLFLRHSIAALKVPVFLYLPFSSSLEFSLVLSNSLLFNLLLWLTIFCIILSLSKLLRRFSLLITTRVIGNTNVLEIEFTRSQWHFSIKYSSCFPGT